MIDIINVKNIKKSITSLQISNLLEQLGSKQYKQSDKEQIYYSVCHHADCLNHKPKLYYYTESQQFMCYACDFSGDIISLVQHVKSYSFVEALNWICEKLNIDSGVETTPEYVYNWQKDLMPYLHKETKEVELQVFDDDVLQFFNCGNVVIEDWVKEGISAKVQEKYEIGYYKLHNSIVIPCRDDNNNLIGIRERFLRPEDCNGGKYKPLSLLNGKYFNFPTNAVFYGINQNIEAIKRKKEVWLVEGEKSILKFCMWFGKNNLALAMYGSNFSKQRREYLLKLGVKSVIIMIDSDFKQYGDEDYILFEKKVFKIVDMLKGFFEISVCYNNQGYDGYKFAPCDFSKEQFKILYKNREVIK